MERLLFNTKRHQNIAFHVSSTPNIHIKFTPLPSSRWGIFQKLDKRFEIRSLRCAPATTKVEVAILRSKTLSKPSGYFAITESLIITFKLGRPDSYTFNFRNTTEFSGLSSLLCFMQMRVGRSIKTLRSLDSCVLTDLPTLIPQKISCEGQSSVQRLPPCKHISLCNRNGMPHIQYCKFCKTVKNVYFEEAIYYKI